MLNFLNFKKKNQEKRKKIELLIKGNAIVSSIQMNAFIAKAYSQIIHDHFNAKNRIAKLRNNEAKTLQEIQEFNRRKIICVISGTENYEEALKIEYAKKGNNTISVPFREYEGEDLTLDRVLLGLTFNNISQLKPELKFYNGFIITISGYAWALTEPTLEEQSEETQRAIYELLGGENE